MEYLYGVAPYPRPTSTDWGQELGLLRLKAVRIGGFHNIALKYVRLLVNAASLLRFIASLLCSSLQAGV